MSLLRPARPETFPYGSPRQRANGALGGLPARQGKEHPLRSPPQRQAPPVAAPHRNKPVGFQERRLEGDRARDGGCRPALLKRGEIRPLGLLRICRQKRVWIDHAPSRTHPARCRRIHARLVLSLHGRCRALRASSASTCARWLHLAAPRITGHQSEYSYSRRTITYTRSGPACL